MCSPNNTPTHCVFCFSDECCLFVSSWTAAQITPQAGILNLTRPVVNLDFLGRRCLSAEGEAIHLVLLVFPLFYFYARGFIGNRDLSCCKQMG